jgi:hypothetical protein
MKFFNILKVLGILVFLGSPAFALNLDWEGTYRFEWHDLDRPSLSTPSQRKSYGLGYLRLSPKIIAADGVNIASRFDIMNGDAYPNSQLGQIWGMNASSNPVTSDNQGSANVRVSHLYLNVNQEYGSLIVGRAPFEFGLGMSYSAGQGLFDHWYDNRDMVAYKIFVGDWFMMPIVSRKVSSGFNQGGTITSTGFQLQYESEENKSLIGIFQENIKGPREVLGYSASQISAYGGDALTRDLNIQRTNFILGRGFSSFGFKFEAGFQSGETGITLLGENVSLNGFGIATEVYVPPSESKFNWSLKFGMASGDDAVSKDYSGFAFNKNYNVGMLMFNHRLGQFDFLNTNIIKDANLNVGNSADDESVSNAAYIAPSVLYSWSDRTDLRNTLVYGQLLNTLKNSIDSSKLLGLEWDIELIYKPSEKIQWINQFGLLFSGEAFRNGVGPTGNLGNELTYGFASKAAISF